MSDVVPDFWLALKGGVGEIGQGGMHIGTGPGHPGINERDFAVVQLLQDELVDGGDGEFGCRLARKEIEDGGEVFLGVAVVI